VRWHLVPEADGVRAGAGPECGREAAVSGGQAPLGPAARLVGRSQSPVPFISGHVHRIAPAKASQEAGLIQPRCQRPGDSNGYDQVTRCNEMESVGQVSSTWHVRPVMWATVYVAGQMYSNKSRGSSWSVSDEHRSCL
jgi:hypothetical protein